MMVSWLVVAILKRSREIRPRLKESLSTYEEILLKLDQLDQMFHESYLDIDVVEIQKTHKDILIARNSINHPSIFSILKEDHNLIRSLIDEYQTIDEYENKVRERIKTANSEVQKIERLDAQFTSLRAILQTYKVVKFDTFANHLNLSPSQLRQFLIEANLPYKILADESKKELIIPDKYRNLGADKLDKMIQDIIDQADKMSKY